jgi:hypothetical protein
MKPPFQLRRLPTRAERLRSEIAQLEARYDSDAMPRSIYEVLKRMRAELARRTAEGKYSRGANYVNVWSNVRFLIQATEDSRRDAKIPRQRGVGSGVHRVVHSLDI